MKDPGCTIVLIFWLLRLLAVLSLVAMVWQPLAGFLLATAFWFWSREIQKTFSA